MNLDLIYQDIHKKDFGNHLHKYFNENESRNLFITGKAGRGKTYFAAGYLKCFDLKYRNTRGINRVQAGTGEIFETPYGKECEFYNIPRLIFRLRNSFSDKSKESANDIINKINKNWLIVLDDYASDKITDYALSTIYLIVDYRISNSLKTVFVSNLNLEQISEIDERLASRLSAFELIEFTGKDRRLENEK